MQLLITLKPSSGDSPPQDAATLRSRFEQFLQRGLLSHGLIASATFADTPGGFLIVEADSMEELDSLLGSYDGDSFYVSVNHLLPYQRLVENLAVWDEVGRSYWAYGEAV